MGLSDGFGRLASAYTLELWGQTWVRIGTPARASKLVSLKTRLIQTTLWIVVMFQ